MKNTLHLNLKAEWFEMIFLGSKPEEYRALTPYWMKRFIDINYPWETYDEKQSDLRTIPHDIIYDIIENGYLLSTVMKGYYSTFKQFDIITFSNGYATDRPQFDIEFKGIEIKEGISEWGAEPGKKYFVLKLGNILNNRNCARFVIENMEDDCK